MDVKKNIYDLACNRLDTQIAIVENQGMFDSVQESSVRLYDVGRKRDDEDEAVIYFRIILCKVIYKLAVPVVVRPWLRPFFGPDLRKHCLQILQTLIVSYSPNVKP